jgi:hypothetical protein
LPKAWSTPRSSTSYYTLSAIAIMSNLSDDTLRKVSYAPNQCP